MKDIEQFNFALMPAVPGLVLGLAYIFFLTQKITLNFIYATMIILVVNTIVHFYTVSHLTAVTALKQMDKEFESFLYFKNSDL